MKDVRAYGRHVRDIYNNATIRCTDQTPEEEYYYGVVVYNAVSAYRLFPIRDQKYQFRRNSLQYQH